MPILQTSGQSFMKLINCICSFLFKLFSTFFSKFSLKSEVDSFLVIYNTFMKLESKISDMYLSLVRQKLDVACT